LLNDEESLIYTHDNVIQYQSSITVA